MMASGGPVVKQRGRPFLSVRLAGRLVVIRSTVQALFRPPGKPGSAEQIRFGRRAEPSPAALPAARPKKTWRAV
jgi:hypothetical protein